LTSPLKKRQFFIGDLALVDKELILKKLSEIEEHLQELEEFKNISIDDYRKNWKIQRIVERTLQILIEICIDVANHIISDEKWRVPFFKNMNLSANLKAIFKLRILSPYIILLSDSLNLNYLLVRPKVKSLVLEQELWQ